MSYYGYIMKMKMYRNNWFSYMRPIFKETAVGVDMIQAEFENTESALAVTLDNLRPRLSCF